MRTAQTGRWRIMHYILNEADFPKDVPLWGFVIIPLQFESYVKYLTWGWNRDFQLEFFLENSGKAQCLAIRGLERAGQRPPIIVF